MRLTTISYLLVFASSMYCSAQKLELNEIMKGEDFIGHSPVYPRWTIDNQTIVFDWNPENEPGNSSFGYDMKSKKTTQLPVSESSIPTIDHSEKSYNSYYYAENGRLIRYNQTSKERTVIFSTSESIQSIVRSTNESMVYFVQNLNVYIYNEKAGSIQQLTDFKQGNAPSTEKKHTTLEQQQLELFDYIKDNQKRKEWRKSNEMKVDEPISIFYEKSETLEDLIISSNGKFITFKLRTETDDASTHVENFITNNGSTQTQQARPKVSDQDPKNRLGIIDLERDTVYFVSTDLLSEIRKKPIYLQEYSRDLSAYTANRSVTFHRPIFHENQNTALVDIRAYDNKDRWIVLLDLKTGKLKELEHQHDEAWIGGPGISSWNEEPGALGWLDGNEFYFQSEETGYSHIYKMNSETGKKTALTKGNWEVHDVIRSNDKKTLYLLANKIHPGVRNGYALRVDDGMLMPLFEGNFGIEWVLSPNEKMWAIRMSTMTQPWELKWAENKTNAKLVSITKSTRTAFEELKLQVPQIVEIPTSDQKKVYARLYTPDQPNGAAVLFVHGAGYLQNAHYYWSGYYREFLFHQLLIKKGYTVIDVDYRASEGYGRDVRTAIYRNMGERDLLDYIDAKAFLVKNHKIDSTRVGIYGGSYGGFITLMGMLKTPGTFACGAALRSVTDWAHYNHEYTSNILNYPGTDSLAYRRSSPIYYANGLQGPLLMLHGMVDDNVQFQDIVRLNQRFIELEKKSFDLAVFPTEAHGFTTTVAWIDEYSRILKLFETHLQKK